MMSQQVQVVNEQKLLSDRLRTNNQQLWANYSAPYQEIVKVSKRHTRAYPM